MVLMTSTQYTTVWWGVMRFTCRSHQKNRGKKADALTGTEEQRLPRLLQTWSLQARRGHRAEREGRELTASCGSHGAVGPRTGQARHTLWRPRMPACLGTGALEESVVCPGGPTTGEDSHVNVYEDGSGWSVVTACEKASVKRSAAFAQLCWPMCCRH